MSVRYVVAIQEAEFEDHIVVSTGVREEDLQAVCEDALLDYGGSLKVELFIWQETPITVQIKYTATNVVITGLPKKKPPTKKAKKKKTDTYVQKTGMKVIK